MSEQSTASQQTAQRAPNSKLTRPLLYLSSEGAGWEGLVAQAFHEPMELEGWLTPGLPDISLVLFAGGAMRLEQRNPDGPWNVWYLRQGQLNLRSGVDMNYELRWKTLSSVPTRTLHLRL